MISCLTSEQNRFILFLFFVGMASPIAPYKPEILDIHMSVCDYGSKKYTAAPLSAYIEAITKSGQFNFSEYKFTDSSNIENVTDFLLVYKPTSENYLQGYYFRTGDAAVSQYAPTFKETVKPIYQFLNSSTTQNLNTAFTTRAAKFIYPDCFNAPLKQVFYQYAPNVDLGSPIPVFFVIPVDESDEDSRPNEFNSLSIISAYYINEDGGHNFVIPPSKSR